MDSHLNSLELAMRDIPEIKIYLKNTLKSQCENKEEQSSAASLELHNNGGTKIQILTL